MKAPIVSFAVADDDAAREYARQIADRTGKEVVVKDKLGRELFRVQPTDSTTRNLD